MKDQPKAWVDVDDQTGKITLEVPRHNVSVELTRDELLDVLNYSEGAFDLLDKFDNGGREPVPQAVGA